MKVSTRTLTLAATDLAPSRGGRLVAAGVSFDLFPGGALVLRGANGSGKSSVLRAIAGLCAYEGRVAFGRGGTLVEAALARAGDVHLLTDGGGLAPKLTAHEHIAFWAGLYGVSPAKGLARVGLADVATSPAGALSTGQRRRLALARLLMAPRALWLLDEPLSGLDAGGRDLLLGAAAAHRAGGGMVLMATHEAAGLPNARVLRLA